MRIAVHSRARWSAALVLPFTLIPCFAAAAEWQQTASVNFHEMPWGRYTEIVIEQLPSIDAAIEASQDPEKLAAMVAEAQARGMESEDFATDQAVVILIPGLEYGMSGTFTNVRIESGNGISVTKDGKIGARLAPTRAEYTGVVTLEEFTETSLKGSYAADLYNEHMTDREIRAKERDFVGRVSADFDIDLSPPDSSVYDQPPADSPGYNPVPSGMDPFNLPDVPKDLDDKDTTLVRRMQEAGVPPETQGAMLQMLRDLPPEQVDTVLKSYKSSY